MEINRNDIYGSVGPNGSGKTTLLKILSGLLYPDSGEVYVNGYSIYENISKIMESTLLILSEPWYALFGYLTPFENLYLFGRLWGLNKNTAKERALEALRKVGLAHKANESIGRLSDGQRARVALAKMFVIQPPIVLLDEPTREIDPAAAKEIRVLIKEYIREYNSTIVFASHIMSEVEEICSKVSIINNGEIVMSGTVDEIKLKISPNFSVLVAELCFVDVNFIEKELKKMNEVLYYIYRCIDSALSRYEFKVFSKEPDYVLDKILDLAEKCLIASIDLK